MLDTPLSRGCQVVLQTGEITCVLKLPLLDTTTFFPSEGKLAEWSQFTTPAGPLRLEEHPQFE